VRIEQALVNLISNATKYGPGKPVDISVGADASNVSITVEDRGIGIGPEDNSRIFELFERAVPSAHYGGLGLGLFVTRQIVEACGGSIEVASVPGQGSLFRISLPVRTQARSERRKTDPSLAAPVEWRATKERPILVVDDDSDIRDTLTAVLEGEGYRVVGARNGLEALRYLERAAPLPALILLDIMMPLMNGVQFRKAQKKNLSWREIAVIVMTASSRQDTVSKMDGDHLDGMQYLSKPIGLTTLVDLVARSYLPAGPATAASN
jgi:CheY-like chemotaxis protein